MTPLAASSAFYLLINQPKMYPAVDRVHPKRECSGCRTASRPCLPRVNADLRKVVRAHRWAGVHGCGVVLSSTLARAVGVSETDLVPLERGMALLFPEGILPPSNEISGDTRSTCRLHPSHHALGCPGGRYPTGLVEPGSSMRTFESFGAAECPRRMTIVGRDLALRFCAEKLHGLVLGAADGLAGQTRPDV